MGVVERTEEAGMFEVRALPGKGDAVVATRSIAPSSAILIEEAALVGPSSNNACIDCLSSEVNQHKTCPGCRHVLCSQESTKNDVTFVKISLFFCKDLNFVLLLLPAY